MQVDLERDRFRVQVSAACDGAQVPSFDTVRAAVERLGYGVSNLPPDSQFAADPVW